MSQGPYAGVRVLDLGTGISAPYAAMFLADQGADVVKVEGRAGDPYRTRPGFQTVNRNKRSAVIDPGVLLPHADVVITGRPVLGPALRAANPSAVIIHMPPWGSKGPMVDAPISRTLLHAATGISWNQQSYGATPVDIVVPIAAYATGVLGALAAAAGLLVRRRRGVAPIYEVSQVAGAAALQLGEFRLDGDDEPRPSDSPLGSKGRLPCYRLVEAGDGRWLFLAALTDRFYRNLLKVIGRPELIDDPLLPNPPWGLLNPDSIAQLTPILDEAFLTRSRDEWLKLLKRADVPAQPVQTRNEFLDHSVVAANDMDVSVDHPELGPVSMMGLPLSIDESPPPPIGPAPLLGQHTEEVVAEWTASPPTASGVSAGGAVEEVTCERPLAGLALVDLSSFIAGPVVGRHLAMLGADVIKVEPPTGDPFRDIGPPFGSWNQGKRSVILDLQTDEGRRTLAALVTEADAVVENFRPGVGSRLGCDRETLQAVNPDMVFLSLPGWGRDRSMATAAAFDPLVQALGGLMACQGGIEADGGGEPVFLTVPLHDVMTPLLGAFGVATGWWQRGRPGTEGGGRGAVVRASLVQSAMVSQVAEFTRFDGKPADPTGGFDHPGDEGDRWEEDDDGNFRWFHGAGSVDVERFGLTASELARANGLVTNQQIGGQPMTVFGQLIGGAGPPPSAAPDLDEHGADIRAEFGPPNRD